MMTAMMMLDMMMIGLSAPITGVCVMLVRVRRDCACACRRTERLTSVWKPRLAFLLHLLQPLAPKLGRWGLGGNLEPIWNHYKLGEDDAAAAPPPSCTSAVSIHPIQFQYTLQNYTLHTKISKTRAILDEMLRRAGLASSLCSVHVY